MKKTFAALASALVLACTPAVFAAAPSAAADANVAAATRELLVTMQARGMLAELLSQQAQQMYRERMLAAARDIVARQLDPAQQKDEVARANARLATEQAAILARFADPALADEMIEQLLPLYADTYTLEEIRQLTAFYASPLGRKMQAGAPMLMKRSAEIARWFAMSGAQATAPQDAQATR